MSEWPFIIAAYAVTWGMLAGYAAYLWWCGRRASRVGSRARVERR